MTPIGKTGADPSVGSEEGLPARPVAATAHLSARAADDARPRVGGNQVEFTDLTTAPLNLAAVRDLRVPSAAESAAGEARSAGG